ncbi:membrane-bound lytic murein transglycosylase C [Sulfurivirga caldicuralii]|uniref:Membrane-bound lytic murein transglycosylase C n=1 Tax=Sulfurivirga caldicuralii TaxID=364032 RepID=A0A1N6HD82_9GAMM|nr:murein transglycosylase domain-containing protein [Sulfurivirga caldicuralii]SIO17798.1 membrane-bound lytic murein transglycosylase C [Sulfurivirga caldicuralii]
MKRRTLLTLLGGGLLSGCTPSEIRRGISAAQHLARKDVAGAITSQVPSVGVPVVDSLLRRQLAQLLKQAGIVWGDKKVPSRREVVKYTDHYQSRALIDFSRGQITVETQRDRAALRQAIVATLLAPQDPTQFDLFSDAPPITLKSEPFLYQLVLDQDRKPIRTLWRARRYADWLIAHRLQRVTINGKPRLRVQFAMVDNIPGVQQHRYAAYVLRHARRYHLPASLIWAIIEVESSFNPYAVSPAPAYGLMQVVPRTAGRDAHRYLTGRDGIPSRTTLFKPASNIEYGSTYLHLLNSRYLAGIHNPTSRRYCIIAAYNTGAGNVLRAFSSRRSHALARINAMTPAQVYAHLRRHLSHAEARRYVQKVVAAQRKYA